MKLFQMMKTQLTFRIPFFSNIVGSRNIPEYVTNDPISDNISDPIIKLIVKYWKKFQHTHYRWSMQRKKHPGFPFS